MKIGIMGDVHATRVVPENRIDDYWETFIDKFTWCLEKFKQESVDIVIQPGDFFDSSKASDFVKQYLIYILKNFTKSFKILTVFGQHDLRYHSSDTYNTPLKVLERADVVSIIDNKHPLKFDDGDRTVYISGASWFEDIPEPIKHDSENILNILVMHKMVIRMGEKIWEGQSNYIEAERLLEVWDYDIVVSGDNHRNLICNKKKKWLINAGSLMRSRINQLEHKPKIHMIDTENLNKVFTFDVPIKPAQEVFDIERVTFEKERNEDLEAFIDGLQNKGYKTEGLDFAQNILTYIKENNVDKEVAETINTIMRVAECTCTT